jgi:hypothetical protein
MAPRPRIPSSPRSGNDCGDMVPPIGGIESAHLLGNEARSRLRAAGLSNDVIDRLADDFIAEHRRGEIEGFITWALHCAQLDGSPSRSAAR